MPTYAFRCPGCGPFDVVRSMRATDDAQQCPTCAGVAARVFSPPAVRRVTPSLSRALGAAERSAHQPDVVRAGPSRRPLPVSTDPRHAALPRP